MSVERKYSVREIDHMRVSVARLDSDGGSRADRANRIEAKLRTYLVAGVDPTELRAAADKGREGWTWCVSDCNDREVA